MPLYVGLDVSQETSAICAVDDRGERRWRGVCAKAPTAIASRVVRHAGADARAGGETPAMTPWLVHGLRRAGISVECLDARRVKAARLLIIGASSAAKGRCARVSAQLARADADAEPRLARPGRGSRAAVDGARWAAGRVPAGKERRWRRLLNNAFTRQLGGAVRPA